mmetsp:Transcript_9883/g.24144  ORF Transcript_9883/g.24144 Transcript_9883/m.24144 type:complete len:204 (+) Transcript_9883:530-1141(+)
MMQRSEQHATTAAARRPGTRGLDSCTSCANQGALGRWYSPESQDLTPTLRDSCTGQTLEAEEDILASWSPSLRTSWVLILSTSSMLLSGVPGNAGGGAFLSPSSSGSASAFFSLTTVPSLTLTPKRTPRDAPSSCMLSKVSPVSFMLSQPLSSPPSCVAAAHPTPGIFLSISCAMSPSFMLPSFFTSTPSCKAALCIAAWFTD